MGQLRYITLGLFGVGIFLAVLPFISGTETLAYCSFEGFWGQVYEWFGIYPPGYSINIDWSELRVAWDDGCNGHVSTLHPTILGILLLLGGVGIRKWNQEISERLSV